MPGANGSHGGGNANSNGPGRSGHGGGMGDRLPPQNLEAERSVLGSILLDNEVLHDVSHASCASRISTGMRTRSSKLRFATCTIRTRGSIW